MDNPTPQSEPVPAAAFPEGGPDRRRALQWLSILFGGLAAAVAGLPVVGFFLAPVRRQRDTWVDLGKAESFPAGETRLVKYKNPHTKKWDGMTGMAAAYVRRRTDGKFQVFALNCAHLGCPVSWFPQAGLFLCPCHGGVYYEDGSLASGPPPRGLFEYPTKIEGGVLKILAGHLPTLQDTFEHPA
jgi:quinol---cytochrome c reductase iron-sulfur subunit, bacillus type